MVSLSSLGSFFPTFKEISISLMKSNVKQQDTAFQDRQVCRESIKKCTNQIHYFSHRGEAEQCQQRGNPLLGGKLCVQNWGGGADG